MQSIIDFQKLRGSLENEICSTQDNDNIGIQNKPIVEVWKVNTKWQKAFSKSSEITENS